MTNLMTHEQAVIFDIQRFSLHDGPGIRTTVFFKGCPLRCLWCQNPESYSVMPELSFSPKRCNHCHQCEDVCPQQAIHIESVNPINFALCNNCNICSDACIQNSLQKIGHTYTQLELIQELVKDLDFYQESNGGVTLSGGEPLLYHKYLSKVLPKLKEHQIHINIETAGSIPWKQWKHLITYFDLIYFDIKFIDPSKHLYFTGHSNNRILQNFRNIAHLPHLQARTPLIPGVTDDIDNLEKIACFLEENDKRNIHLLPYNKLAQDKLQNKFMKRENKVRYDYKDHKATEHQVISNIFASHGIEATFYE